jgi:hypothetical protein
VFYFVTTALFVPFCFDRRNKEKRGVLGISAELAEIAPGKGNKKSCRGVRIKMPIIRLPGIGIQRNIGVELLSKN